MTKLTALIPNITHTTIALVLVLVGVAVYTPPASPQPQPRPVKEVETPAVLSDTQTNPTPIAPITPEPPTLPITITLPTVPTLPTPAPQPSAPTEADLVQTQADTAVTDIENNNPQGMFDLLSSDLASTYTEADIEAALSASGQQILSVTNLGSPNITGDYADQNVEVTTNTGTYRFQVFLHKESGVWKIMGTEPLP